MVLENWKEKRMINQQKIDWRVLVAVVAAIMIIECVALINGINGKFLATTLMILGAIGGLALPQIKIK